MPLLVRGVAESQETGMTLIKSFEKVVDNKMVSGPLAKEVKQLVVQMSWGTSFEDALTNFKNKINSPLKTQRHHLLSLRLNSVLNWSES